MEFYDPEPGPDAKRAFRLGMLAAAIAGLGGVGVLYWFDLVEPSVLAFTLLVMYPVYLVVAASVLSVWLGYDKDATDLRPVQKERDGS